MSIELRLLMALWFILPAYVANSIPVDVSKIRALRKYGRPIDGCRCFRGVRILGDGKTWRGLFCGVFMGSLVGLIQASVEQDFQSMLNIPGITLPPMSVGLAFMLSAGALAGDMIASFVKRRVGLRQGDPVPLLDQLDFVFGAFFFAWLLEGAIDYNLFFVVVVITPVVHIFGNLIAWVLKLKKKPW